MAAATKGDARTCSLLLAAGASVSATTTIGKSALVWAAQLGHDDVVKMLLDYGADPNHAMHVQGWGMGKTALIWSSQQGYGNFDIIFGPADHVSSALYHPARAAWCDLVGDRGPRMLIGACNPMLCPNWGSRHATSARLLLEHGADVNYRTPVVGCTAIIMAAQHGHEDVVGLLLVFGAAAAVANAAGCTARTLSEVRGHLTVAALLDSVRGWSAIRIAVGLRRHADASTALRLGLIDPADTAVSVLRRTALLAPLASAAAAVVVPYAAVHDMPDDEGLAAMRAFYQTANAATARLVRDATSGWAPAVHRLYHRGFRAMVRLLLLVSQRQRSRPSVRPPRDAHGVLGANSIPISSTIRCSTRTLPVLPDELWRQVLRCSRRRDWAAAAPLAG